MASAPSQQARLRLTARVGERVVACFDLAEGGQLILGTSSQADCPCPGEKYLSRRHVVLRPHGGHLQVERLSGSANPVLFKGGQHDRFVMADGDYFVIGTTEFHLDAGGLADASGDDRAELRPQEQFTLEAQELRLTGDTNDRLRLLDLMTLPEILRTRSRKEFYIYACGALRMATGARWVQVLVVEDHAPRVLCEDAGLDQVAPCVQSRELVKLALAEAPRPVTYRWQQNGHGELAATVCEGIDWAVCCAMPVPGETPVMFYLAGSMSRAEPGLGSPLGLRDTARLVGLVADAVGRALAMYKLEDWQAKLGHFFSGKLVSKILESEDPRQLAPSIRQATVMFFDIRGFSHIAEGNLARILECQSELKQVMTAMTQCVFDHDGVVIRYMGDGILACWNVPYDLVNHTERASLAAIRMVGLMNEVSPGWGCGIGLGAGDVVAGSLGSAQVYAYDILGPVVNQAARVEGITKEVGVPILVTEEVARTLEPDRVMTRRVARFLPAGVQTEVDLYTIEETPADAAARRAIEERHGVHAEALAAFEQGHWEKAFDLLHPIVKEDVAARYVYTLALQRKPPRDWRGVIEMTHK
ncbi:MAG TPA: adenylate/guanylate cyclase domain-containing protein [Phycisphaerae bacterium]|nr:adenylate/guanylate cyclase domain-containing protein [Phycisphaerae bacterium]HRY69830.1 adenylate/guanylate cyclase domain-containing protein [Phycisphaerae bacterium]HSA25443.1 adenylate/guanylate cyclase domain-containing protein [Phycisphaerae bacterium]